MRFIPSNHLSTYRFSDARESLIRAKQSYPNDTLGFSGKTYGCGDEALLTLPPITHSTRLMLAQGRPITFHLSPPSLKGLSHHLFALLPQGGGQLRIEGIPAYAFANGANGHIVCYNMADMAILAVFPTNLVSPRHNPGPY